MVSSRQGDSHSVHIATRNIYSACDHLDEPIEMSRRQNYNFVTCYIGIIIRDRSVHPLISLISRSVRYKYNALYIHAPKNYLLPFWCAEYPVRVIAILAYAIQFYGILPVHGQVLLCKEWTPNTLSVTNILNATYNIGTVKQYVVPAIDKQPYSTNTCIHVLYFHTDLTGELDDDLCSLLMQS